MQNILHITTPAEWRKWLQEHYNQESEAWLVYAKKATGKPRIVYNDAVEEALCFGWIEVLLSGASMKLLLQSRLSQPTKTRMPFSLPRLQRTTA